MQFLRDAIIVECTLRAQYSALQIVFELVKQLQFGRKE